MPTLTESERNNLLLAARQYKKTGLNKQDAGLLLSASTYYQQAGNEKEAADMGCIAVLIYLRRRKYTQAIPVLIIFADYLLKETSLLQQITNLFPDKSLPEQVQKHFQTIKSSTLSVVTSLPETPETPEIPAILNTLLELGNANIGQELIKSLSYKTLAVDSLWKQAGVYNASLCFIIKGHLHACLEIGGMQKTMADLKSGDICGEQSYYLRKAGIIYVRAKETTTIAECSFEDLDLLLPKLPHLQAYFHKKYASRLLLNQLLLAPTLSQLPIEDVQMIANNMQEYNCNAGTALFTQGKVADYVYILRTGRIVLTNNIHGRDVIITTISSGALLGDEVIASKDGLTKINAYSINHCLLWRMTTNSMQECYKKSKNIKRLIDWRFATQGKNLKSLTEIVNTPKDKSSVLRNEIWDA
ncbi:MAG: cyclic nucleotide-binding domain-containing protein [Mariprofundales bacterium]